MGFGEKGRPSCLLLSLSCLFDADLLAALKVPHEDLLKLIPMGRLGLSSEVAKVIAFLVSEDVSYLTGQVIGVNGGML